MKTKLLISFAALLASSHPSMAQGPPAPSDLKGGTGGQEERFECPDRSFIKEISGKADYFMNQITFVCSDPAATTSKSFGGTAGTFFSVPESNDGYHKIGVRGLKIIDSVEIDGQTYGAKGSNVQFFEDSRCPATGVRVRSGERIYALGFIFNCEGNQHHDDDNGDHHGDNDNQHRDDNGEHHDDNGYQHHDENNNIHRHDDDNYDHHDQADRNSAITDFNDGRGEERHDFPEDREYRDEEPLIPPADLSECTVCSTENIELNGNLPEVVVLANALQKSHPTFRNSANAYGMAQALVNSKSSGDPAATTLVSSLVTGTMRNRAVSNRARAVASALAQQRVGASSGVNTRVFAIVTADAVSGASASASSRASDREYPNMAPEDGANRAVPTYSTPYIPKNSKMPAFKRGRNKHAMKHGRNEHPMKHGRSEHPMKDGGFPPESPSLLILTENETGMNNGYGDNAPMAPENPKKKCACAAHHHHHHHHHYHNDGGQEERPQPKDINYENSPKDNRYGGTYGRGDYGGY